MKRLTVLAMALAGLTALMGSCGGGGGAGILGAAVPPGGGLARAGGATDAARAESLVTMANFLVDVQLSKYTLLEIVSGGFEQPLFDPDVEVAAADLEALFGMYEEILAQKDGVLAAFRQIQG